MANKEGKRDFGRIRQFPSGRWQAAYTVDGELIKAPGTFDSRGDAARWLSAHETDIARKTWIDPRLAEITVREYSEDEWIPSMAWSPRTYDTNVGNLKNHVYPYFGDTKLGALNTSRIRKWNKEEKERFPSAGAKAYGLLRQLCAQAVIDRYLLTNPCIVKGGASETPRAGQAGTADHVQAYADNIVPRLRAWVFVAAYGETRYGEAIFLKLKHIDWVGKGILVEKVIGQRDNGEFYESDPKGTQTRLVKSRYVTLPDFVMDELRTHVSQFVDTNDPEAFLFRGPTGATPRRQNWSKLWKSAGKRAGLLELKLRPHDLRHTGNSLADSVGATTADRQERGGWSTAAMAEHYAHSSSARQRMIADNLDAIARAAAARAMNQQDAADAEIIQMPGVG